MDLLSALLATPRASGAFVIRSDLRAPWSIRVEDGAPLTLVVPIRGDTRIEVDGRDPVHLATGEVALVRGEDAYTICDRSETPAQALIGPGQTCTKPDGSPLSDFRALGVLAWTNVPSGETPESVLLTATYEQVGQVSHRLVDLLPPVVVVGSAEDVDQRLMSLLDLLAQETMAAESAGPATLAGEVVVDRLVDLLLVTVLRDWLERGADAGAGGGGGAHPRPAWLGTDDLVVQAALRRVHHEPQRPWTLASLAADVGVSRATLARRFREVVGEPVMAYLARWRLDLAADLLTTSDLTVAAIATRVGYASGFSLSNAFATARGTSPTEVRRAAARAG